MFGRESVEITQIKRKQQRKVVCRVVRGPLLCSCRVMWVVSVGRERGVCVQAPAPISPRSALALYNVLKTRAKAPKSPQNALFLPPNAPKSPIFAQKMPKSTKKLQNQLKKLQNQLKFCKIN